MGRKFSKYHGAGNDFVMIDGRTEPFDATPERVAALCRRRTGIGADGLMILESDPAEEFRMRYFNADGGEATMCGNGGRCIALFAHHLGIGGMRKRFIGVDGPHTAELLRVEGPEGEIRLGMIDVRRVEVHPEYLFLDTGSPHYVEFVESVRGVDVAGRGAAIRPRRYERQLRRDRFRRPYPHKDFRAGRRGRDARLRNGSDRLGYRCGRAHGQPVPGLPGRRRGRHAPRRVRTGRKGRLHADRADRPGPESVRRRVRGRFSARRRAGIPQKILTWHEEAEAARKLCRIQYRTIVNFITFSRIMKSNRGFRHKASDGGSEDLLRRAAKLSPIKKSGKDKRTIYSQMDDDEADAELLALRKQESVLDYFDDEQER